MKSKIFIGLAALSLIFIGNIAFGSVTQVPYAGVASQAIDAKTNLSSDFQIEFGPMHKTEYKIFYMGGPPRLIIDFKDQTLKTKFDKNLFSGTPVKNIRTGLHDHGNGVLRVVLDLTEPVIFKDHLVADEAAPGDMKLVVDIILKSNPNAKVIEQNLSNQPATSATMQPSLPPPVPVLPQQQAQQNTQPSMQPIAPQQPMQQKPLPSMQSISPQQQELQKLLQQPQQPQKSATTGTNMPSSSVIVPAAPPVVPFTNMQEGGPQLHLKSPPSVFKTPSQQTIALPPMPANKGVTADATPPPQQLVPSGTNSSGSLNSENNNGSMSSSNANNTEQRSRLFETLRNQRIMGAVAARVSRNLLTKDIVGR